MCSARMLPSTRSDALSLGLGRYLGRPCKAGHTSGRYTASCACVECDSERHRMRSKVGQMRDIGVSRVGNALTITVPPGMTITIKTAMKEEPK